MMGMRGGAGENYRDGGVDHFGNVGTSSPGGNFGGSVTGEATAAGGTVTAAPGQGLAAVPSAALLPMTDAERMLLEGDALGGMNDADFDATVLNDEFLILGALDREGLLGLSPSLDTPAESLDWTSDKHGGPAALPVSEYAHTSLPCDYY